MKSVKLICLFFIVVMSSNNSFSINFYTKSGGTGQYGNNSHWVGAPAGRPGNNSGYSNYSGPSRDTIFINHPLSVNSDFTLGDNMLLL